jgi:hypothetical protein
MKEIWCLLIAVQTSNNYLKCGGNSDRFSLRGMPQVRHLDFKKEKDVEREGLIKFLSDAICSQFKNPTIWS